MADPTNPNGKLYGVLAEFKDVTDLYHAIGKVRDAGYTKWDVYCPFPVHDADAQMGLKPSKIAFVTGFAAATGLALAIFLQYWTSAVDYPVTVAGKPNWAWEQFTPIMFELSVLFGGGCTIIGMLIINKLPRFNHPLFESDNFLRASDDKLFIAIEARDAKYAEAHGLLRELGAVEIEEVHA